ncbi:nucleotidyltransferase family protein [Selenomonas ruminantium]|uniref:Polymerase beta nucleotidyltransferase domain-containing protein n=1 Tax=Selenomonas ruminantium TaxID=971 RepID=A0A1H0UF65_SELRU|nr:nucleotidyltransferase domain-containing protein [Selenomonas ruminantium]SDP64781.1 hypothetical protein SAMN05216366_1327 [Selenomonas ruminantium]
MYTIDAIKEKITPICKQYMVKKVFLFGSYARGDAKEGSDIDIRIEAGNIEDLFTLSSFRQDIIAALGIEVDIISASITSLDTPLRKNLESEEILLYAA